MEWIELYNKIKDWAHSPPFPLPDSIPYLQTLLEVLTPNGSPIEAPPFISSPAVCLRRVEILFLLSDRIDEPNANALGNNHAMLTNPDCDEITAEFYCDTNRFALALTLDNLSTMIIDELSDAMSVEMIRLSRFVNSSERHWVLRRFVEYSSIVVRLWHLSNDHQDEHDLDTEGLPGRRFTCDEFRTDLLSKFESIRWQANSHFGALRTTLTADVQQKMKQLQIARDLDEDLVILRNSESLRPSHDDQLSPTLRIQGQPVEDTITGGNVPGGGPDARRFDGSPTGAKSPKPKPVRRRRKRNNEKRDTNFYMQHYVNKMTINEIVANYNTRPGGKDQVTRDAVKKAIQRQAKRL